MAEHKAIIHWERASADFLAGKYSREHTWIFDGGAKVLASPTPAVVPVPYSNPALVDPEEAFVASLSSCHMLTFLHVARLRRFQVDCYRDEAVGLMGRNEKGIPWVSEVRLCPQITYGGERIPTPSEEVLLHEAAHEQCFIANSVKTAVVVLPPADPVPAA